MICNRTDSREEAEIDVILENVSDLFEMEIMLH